MAQSAIDKIPPGPKLDALAAEKVFGWRNVHQHEGTLVGKKQDWPKCLTIRPTPSTHIPSRANESAWAFGPILEGTLQDYPRQQYFLRLGFPGATISGGDQAMGQYGQVVPLSRSRKQPQK